MSGGDEFGDALWTAMSNGDTGRLDALVKVNPGLVRGDCGPDIFNAIIQCPIETIRWFVARGALEGVAVDDGFPALHCAVDRERPDRYDVVRELVRAGVDVNERGINDWTPLHRAAAGRDDAPMARLLLELGADASARTRIDDYATPEEEARRMGAVRSADAIRDWLAERKR